ncbi:MAG: ferredoxin--NADP reductase, partial [Pseudomonadota bacterium]
RLARLSSGDSLWVTRHAGGRFTLADMPRAPCLWMMATGTGIGPYLSILREAEVWQHFDRLFLVHGVRRSQDLVYREWLEDLEGARQGRFRYLPVVSREANDFALRGRIPALLEEGKLEDCAGTAIESGSAHVMLCGNQAMIRDAIQILGERGMRRHSRRESGHITTERYH